MIIWISAPHLCGGVYLEYGKVTEAPPILYYMMGWHEKQVVGYCLRKKWQWRMMEVGA